MTKEAAGIIFFLSWLMCLISILFMRRKTHRLTGSVVRLLEMSCLTIMFYYGTLVFNDFYPVKVALNAYFASMDWLCYALFLFAIAFTRIRFPEWLKKTLTGILILDSGSMILNIFLNHALDYTTEMVGREMFVDFIPKPMFEVHLAICYALIAGTILLLLYGAITAPHIYKVQFATILFFLGLLVGSNAVFLFTQLNVDISIVGYGLVAMLVSYYALYFIPGNLMMKMSNRLLNAIPTGVVLFDVNGDLVYENRETENWDGERGTDRESIFRILNIRLHDNLDVVDVERTFKQKGKIRILHITYRPLMEPSGRGTSCMIGSYLVMKDITEERKQLKEREYKASHDELTGLYNRGKFLAAAQELMDEYPDEPYSILMTNLYQFKVYNELFGYEAGDRVLTEIARSFREKVTATDVAYGRFDADRFVVCLPTRYCTDEVFERYQTNEPLQDNRFRLVNYIGVCNSTDSERSVASMCERAAIALSTIKGDESKKIVYYDRTMKDELLFEKQLTSSFEAVLEQGEITYYVQPQVNQNSGCLSGGEVLARWIKADGTMISPAVFVPALEHHGLIIRLDQFIWDQTYQLVRRLYDAGIPTSLSVNLSVQDFYYCDIYETFMGLAKKYELPAHMVKLEITESCIMNDMESHIATIKRLQEHGFIIEMDDFGSGYSSLNSLKDIPVNILKMDMRFLDGADSLNRGRDIISVVALLANTLKLPLIAEGVETTEQAEFLKSIECRYIQGYLYGKPMKVEEFVEMRRERGYEEMV